MLISDLTDFFLLETTSPSLRLLERLTLASDVPYTSTVSLQRKLRVGDWKCIPFFQECPLVPSTIMVSRTSERYWTSATLEAYHWLVNIWLAHILSPTLLLRFISESLVQVPCYTFSANILLPLITLPSFIFELICWWVRQRPPPLLTHNQLTHFCQ